MPTSPDAFAEEIFALVAGLVPDAQPDPARLASHAWDEIILRDLGIDSLRLVQFVNEVEKRFGIELADDLNTRDFASVGSVLRLIERSREATPHAAPKTDIAVDAPAPTLFESTDVLWPALAPEARLLLCTARFEMSPTHVALAEQILRGDDPPLDWGAFLDLAARHRILPLVAASFDRGCLGPLGTVRRSTLRSAYLYNRGRTQAWARERGDLLAAFESAGIRPVVRKGSVLSQAVYPDSAMRYMEDMDVYVCAQDLDAFTATMADLGYRQGSDSRNRRTVEPLDRETEVFWKLNVAALPPFLRPTSDPHIDVFSVDARRDLMEPASGKSIPAEDFVARSRRVPLAGAHAWVPSYEDMLLDLGVHLYREATTLSSIRSGKDICLIRFLDIIHWYRHSGDDLDHSVLTSRAENYDVKAELYFSLHFADLLYPEIISPELLDAMRPDDLAYLDRYGDLDGRPAVWASDFMRRAFDRERAHGIADRSALPRPRRQWTDDHPGAAR